MQKLILLGLLGWCSLVDIKRKELTVMYLLMFGIGGVLLHLFAPVCTIYSILWGMLLGVGMILVSFLSKGSVGLGDGILLVVTGVYLGGYQNLELFMTGLLFAAFWSLGMMLFKRKKGKEEIAFVPFLLLSYVAMILRGV